MLTTIHITVRDRVPTITAGEDVISHNSDYVAEFEFDEEWQDKVKTVYFVCEDGSYQAVVMDGNSCGVPMLDGEHRRIFVGVQAGSAEKPSVLKTTRPCCLKVKDSIADYLGQPIPDPTPDVYEQIIAMLESITSPTWDDVQNKPFSTLGGGLAVDENGVLSAQGGGETWVKLVDTILTEAVESVTYTFDNCKRIKALIAPANANGEFASGWIRITINNVAYPSFNGKVKFYEGIDFEIDSEYPPYVQGDINAITNTTTYGIISGKHAASLENIAPNGVTEFGCQTAALLKAGTKIEIWGVKS